MRVASLLLFAALASPASALNMATSCPHEHALYLPASAGKQFGRHAYAGHGVRVGLRVGSRPSGITVAATTPMAGWRVCGMAGYGWYVPGTLGARGPRPAPGRPLTRPPPRHLGPPAP